MLKKTLLFILALGILAGNAFATDVSTFYTSASTFTIAGFRPSKSVSVGYDDGATQTVYAICSKHTNGDKIYMSNSVTTKIYMKASTAGTALADSTPAATIPTDASTEPTTTGYTSM